jgi:hypothetical protein
MNLGVPPAKLGDIGLKTRRIEPVKHLVELLTQKESNDGHGQFPKLHRLAHNPAENFRRLRIGQLAPGNLQLQADESFRTLKSQCHKGADIIGGDRLIRLVGADGPSACPSGVLLQLQERGRLP